MKGEPYFAKLWLGVVAFFPGPARLGFAAEQDSRLTICLDFTNFPAPYEDKYSTDDDGHNPHYYTKSGKKP